MFSRRRCMLLSFVILIIAAIQCDARSVMSIIEAEKYLVQYGYLPRHSSKSRVLLAKETFSKAVQDFQNFAGLNVSGALDKATLDLMSAPRCGVHDNVRAAGANRSKRFVIQGSRWPKVHLSYQIFNYPLGSKLTRFEVDREIAKAFAVWSRHSALTFTRRHYGPVDIEIKFEVYDHGDGSPFDGAGGTLAHAFFPLYGGATHFDDSEEWTIGKVGGVNLFQAAVHEFGHALGLDHSEVASSVMTPFYQGYNPSLRLDYDDISALQILYGKRAAPLGRSQLCEDSKIDTIFRSADNQTYVFKGETYYKLNESSVAKGYPKLISERWRGLPGNIDAAFSLPNGKTYFFKGSKYWRYDGYRIDPHFPKNTTEAFPGLSGYLSDATYRPLENKIYFFRNGLYWTLDRHTATLSKPKTISALGVPRNIDAVFEYTNGRMYFFKDDKYYRFNDQTHSMDKAVPSYPRSTSELWFGCI